MSEKTLTVAVPLGIGDAHWCIQKFAGLKKHFPGAKINCYINESANHKTIGYLRMCSVIDEATFSVRAIFDVNRDLPGTYKHPKYATLRGSRGWRGFSFVFCANYWVECGKHIKDWMAELETEYTLDYKWPADIQAKCADLMPNGRTVLLYPSGVGPNYGFHRHWWKPDDWAEIVARLNLHDIIPTFVGAPTTDDLNYVRMIKMTLERDYPKAMYFNAVGKTDIAMLMHMMRESRGVMGLNSGVEITAISMNVPTVMFWADNRFPISLNPNDVAQNFNPLMQTSWQSPEQLKIYRTISFGDQENCTPVNAVQSMMEVIR